jgi:phosphate uptake regulator
METRKVQVTGGSTYTVSLPKGWATEHGVSGGSVVELYPEADSLLVSPRRGDDPTEGRLNVSGLSGDDLVRAVVTMYVSGFDIAVFEATRLSPDQRRTVRQAAQGLVGFEVVEETDRVVRLQDLLDTGEFSVHDAVVRTSVLSIAMLEDAIEGFIAGDRERVADVAVRDDDVDRLHALVVRTFRSALRDPRAATALGIDAETCFDYQQCSRQYERVADHAEKVAGLVGDEPLPDPLAGEVRALYEEAAAVLEDATGAFFETDPDAAIRMAHEARRANVAANERVKLVSEATRDLDTERARSVGLVVDSLSRAADYGGNVAEVALQRAFPSP